MKENRETKEKTGGANLGQAIFHRPTSSGIYAIVCNLEFARIGYNDILQRYMLDEDERRIRGQILLESLLHTFVQLNGAMRSTQLPHLVSMQGVLSWSTTVLPAPLLSPLGGGKEDRESYREQTSMIARSLGGDSIRALNFDSLAELAQHFSNLHEETRPYTMRVGG